MPNKARLRAWILRLWATLTNRERNLEDELRFHLEMAEQAAVRRGDSAREGRLAAGGLAQASEAVRDQTRIVWLSDFLHDGRHAIRLLAKSPMFAAAAIASLSLGVGAITAIFSVVDALMLRPLPVRDPHELVLFKRNETNGPLYNFPYPMFQRLRQQPGVFSSVSASWVVDRYLAGPEPEKVSVCLTSGDYFANLGVSAIRGRTFSSEDDRIPGAHPVAIISHDYWSRRFAFAADVIGRTLTLHDTAYTIVGVAPRRFSGEWIGKPVDLWIPYAMASQVMPEVPGGPDRFPGMLVGRLLPGTSMQQAEAAAHVAFQQIIHADAGPNPTPEHLRFLASRRLGLEPAATGYSERRQSLTLPIAILLAVAGLVLLIACANVANLLLARSSARHREIAIRAAIGAGRGRLIRQLLAESIVLASAAALCGLLCASWGSRILATMIAAATVSSTPEAALASIVLDIRFDARVFAITLAVSYLTVFVFGVVPAIRGSKVSLTPALAARGSGAGTGFNLGKAMVVLQVALTFVLLCGAGLFLRTLRNLQTQDLGFARENVLLIWASPVHAGRNGTALLPLVEQIQQRLPALPRVRSVSVSNGGVLEGGDDRGGPSEWTTFEGLPPKPGMVLRYFAVTPGFFATTGLPLLAGRDFTSRDTDLAPQVAIITETMSRFIFEGRNPIGRRFGGPAGRQIEIVGVAKDARAGTARDSRGVWYVPYRQSLRALRLPWCIAVRTDGDPAAVAAGVREELRRIDAGMPVLRVNTIEKQLSGVLAEDRMLAALSGVFGIIAALIASVGLYGVVSYATSRRLSEIGVRLALGATRSGIVRMILSESLLLIGAGLLLGVPIALAVTRLVTARLFAVRPADPLTIGAAITLMLAVGALASFVPAMRSSRVDPIQVLRHE